MKVEVLECEIATGRIIDGPYVVEIEGTTLTQELCEDALEEAWGSFPVGQYNYHEQSGTWYVNDDDTQLHIKQID